MVPSRKHEMPSPPPKAWQAGFWDRDSTLLVKLLFGEFYRLRVNA